MTQFNNYKDLLIKTKAAIGEDKILHLYIAMFVDMYMEDKPYSDEEFDRVCNYVLGIYNYNRDTILEDVVFTVYLFLQSNPIDVLEDIKYKEFISEFLGIEENS